MQKKQLLLLPFSILLMVSCKKVAQKKEVVEQTQGKAPMAITYAKGFSIQKHGTATIIKVADPWPNANKTFTYALIPKNSSALDSFVGQDYDAVVKMPIETVIVTSTTHIPALEALGALDKLVGFPDTQYISSPRARSLISKGKIKELGSNQQPNTEITLALAPDALIGFGVDKGNTAYGTFKKAGIPVLLNGDWVEQHPLGKAEWIKFFGALLGKEKMADSIFREIETGYLNARELAKKAEQRPSVLSGALYNDVWYLPAGKSWAAHFFADANANYLYADTESTGSLSLGLESVLATATNASFWVSPSEFTSYAEMEKSNSHYLQFEAFRQKRIHTFANTLGPTGGLLYYELAPQRPDLVLKDLIHIFHPGLLPDHSPYFFTPLR